ncbi:MAG: peroxidase-related enzyme [Halofilum sp. (in: g-proteobacteria)]|nr:peroxidase-related enzyme [Halofilum sp. (in: g-proteobacteria)]
MAEFTLHDTTSAPEEVRPRLEAAQASMGFIPNLFAKMAEAPAAVEAYQELDAIFARTSLSAVEREVVLLATSVYNRCHFCVAAHSGRAQKAGMDAADLEALRRGGDLPNPRLDALARFTRAVVDQRGWVDDATVERFLEAGFERRQVLEVIIGVSIKTLSNYTNHITATPLNKELEPLAWDAAA